MQADYRYRNGCKHAHGHHWAYDHLERTCVHCGRDERYTRTGEHLHGKPVWGWVEIDRGLEAAMGRRARKRTWLDMIPASVSAALAILYIMICLVVISMLRTLFGGPMAQVLFYTGAFAVGWTSHFVYHAVLDWIKTP